MNKFSQILFLVIITIWISGCQSETLEKVPDDILSKELMIPILVDVHMLESGIQTRNYNRDSSIILYEILSKGIWKKHHTTEERFRKSLLYYAQDAKVLDEMYSVVLDSVNAIGTVGKYQY
jgi:precorrin isomerase